jgi:SAM-dependent methyltransferase
MHPLSRAADARTRTGSARLKDELLSAASLVGSSRQLRLLNVGAGTTSWLEDALVEAPATFVIDRIDVIEPTIAHPLVRACWRTAVEAMTMIPSQTYDYVVASYVLEHVDDLRGAATQIARVCAPGGRVLIVVPNPLAPEFLLARCTPHRVHRLFQPNASPTRYSYGSIPQLVALFTAAGLHLVTRDNAPVTQLYLNRVSKIHTNRIPDVVNKLAQLYDETLVRLGLSGLMGDVFLMLGAPRSG